MRGYQIERNITFDELAGRLIDCPEPTPGTDEVLVDVHYAGLNFFDLLQIEGKYQVKPPFPYVAGMSLLFLLFCLRNFSDLFSQVPSFPVSFLPLPPSQKAALSCLARPRSSEPVKAPTLRSASPFFPSSR